MKFTIDRATWRCGGGEGHEHGTHGTGPTRLVNQDGFMCCLGFVTLQCGVPRRLAIGCIAPQAVIPQYQDRIPMLVQDQSGTTLTHRAMAINDNGRQTDAERERTLAELFAEHGHEIEFIGEYPRQSYTSVLEKAAT